MRPCHALGLNSRPRAKLVADGAGQLLVLAHFDALAQFRRGDPTPAAGPAPAAVVLSPPPPPLQPPPATQHAAALQAPAPLAVSAPGRRGRRRLSPLGLVLASGALAPAASAKVRAAAQGPPPPSGGGVKAALAEALRGTPAARLHGAVLARAPIPNPRH